MKFSTILKRGFPVGTAAENKVLPENRED